MIRQALALALLAGPAQARALDLPGAATATHDSVEDGAARLPVGPYTDGMVPVREFPGHVSLRAWTIPGDLTTFQVLDPLRTQLRDDGFTLLADCATTDCGGFDFRFAVRVLPEPAMHVDLGDFRYLAAEKTVAGGTEAVALLVSRSDIAAFLQIEAVGPGGGTAATGTAATGAVTVTPGGSAPPVAATGADARPFTPGSLSDTLLAAGHIVLDDLTFDSGSTDLGAGPYASLGELAAFLAADPARRVALVGHTDATGGLDINIAVSRRRAASVVARLTRDFAVPRGQLDAQGVGYLAPRATNLTEAGREANRRVEAVLTAAGAD